MLKTAVRSVLSQTFEDFQVAVYDNASGDETAEIVAQLQQEDPRVTYFCHPENIGMVPNFNYAMERVTTPFFSFLSDDDLLLPGFYETAMRGFQRHPDAAASAGTVVITDMDGLMAQRGPCIQGQEYFTPPEGLLAWRHETKPLITANLFRREVIPQIGLFSEEGYMDMEWEMRLVAQFPYVVSPHPCAIITMHEEHATRQFRSETDQWWKSYTLLENSLHQIPDLPPPIAEAALGTLKREFGRHVYRLGLIEISRGETAPASAIASALRECYKLPQEAARLERISRITNQFGCLRHFYRLIRSIRKSRVQWKTRELRAHLHGYRQAPHKDFVL